MKELGKQMIVVTAISGGVAGLTGAALWYFTSDQQLTFTAAGMCWFVLQLSLTIKAFERLSRDDNDQ